MHLATVVTHSHHPGLLDAVRRYGYVALFIIIGAQDLGVPTLIPGALILVFTGYLAAIGILNPIAAGMAAVAGSLLGGSIVFGLARVGGDTFFRRWGPRLGLDQRRRHSVERMLERGGLWVWLTCRFLPGLRAVPSVVAGFSGLSYRRFLLYSAGAALIWTTSFLLLGLLLGRHWHQAIALVLASGPIALLLGLVALGIFLGMRWRRAPPPDAFERPAGAPVAAGDGPRRRRQRQRRVHVTRGRRSEHARTRPGW